MRHSDLPYRDCVGIALFNKERQVFVGERIDSPGAWQMPQGGVDEGESLEQAAFRELSEEAGTQEADIIRIHDKELTYDLPNHLLGRLWNGKYRGQSQIWVAMEFTGVDDDINLHTHRYPEFRNWQWINLHEVPDFAVPFKKNTYIDVVKAFEDIAQS